ncbi:MAG: TolC family protein [Chitinispirillaceae bacterium]
MRNAWVLIISICFGTLAAPLSLPKAQALLFARNNAIRTAELRHEQSLNQLIEARADWYPSVDIIGNYLFQSKRNRISFSNTIPLFTDTLPLPIPDTLQMDINEQIGDYDRYEIGADIRYPLFTGFARTHATRASEAQVQIRSLEVDMERNSQSLRLGILYFLWEDAMAGVRTQQKRVNRIAEHVGYMRDLHNAGIQPYSQVLVTNVRLEKARMDVLEARGLVDSLRLEITHLLGINDTLAYPAGYHFDSFYSRTKPRREATDIRRPELQSIIFSIEQTQGNHDALKSQRYPSLALSAGYRFANPGLQMGTDELMRYGTLGLHLNWKIYDGMRNWARREQLKRQKQILENRRSYVREEFNKLTRLARQQYEQAQMMEEATEKSLEASKAVARDMENSLDAGTVVSVAYLESLNEVSEAERAFNKAKTTRKISFLRLLYALGENIDF